MKPAEDAKSKDRVLEHLEKSQYWLEIHYRKLIVALVCLLVVVLFVHYKISSEEKHQGEMWAKAATLTTVKEKAEFLANNPTAQASAPLYLETARQELDEGGFKAAKEHAELFIARYPKHRLEANARLLRAYACEELGLVAEAKAECEKIKADASLANVATAMLDRLSRKGS